MDFYGVCYAKRKLVILSVYFNKKKSIYII